MILQTNATIVNLTDCVQGRLVLIVLTGVAANCDLEFQHAGDTNWSKHPGFVGTHTGGVILQEVRCPSPKMRINFGAGVPGDYHLSVSHESQEPY